MEQEAQRRDRCLKYVNGLPVTGGVNLLLIHAEDEIWANQWNLLEANFSLKKKEVIVITLADSYTTLNSDLYTMTSLILTTQNQA